MLKKSFQHIPGIGAKTEQQIWDSGLTDWQGTAGSARHNLSSKRLESIEKYTRESLEHIAAGNPVYFSDMLASKEHWRLFSEFRSSTAYIDIETTGLEMWDFEITTISLYDGKKIFYYVQGQNLDDFIDDIQNYNMIVSYNGKTFDVPFIENHFNTKLKHAHIDLRYVLKSLGYSGGLKKCEKALGIDRGDLDGVDGYFAILLWHDYRENQNKKALETLLAYNIEDVVNLEILMVMAYNMKIMETPFSDILKLPLPRLPEIPFKPDHATIDRLKRSAVFSSGRY